MAAGKFDLKELERRMRGAIDTLKKEFGGPAHRPRQRPPARSGGGQRLRRAHADQPGGDRVDARTRARSRCRSGTRARCSAVEKAIREANLGLNPVIDGALIRLPIPALNAERRQELVKVAHKYAEHARVAVRNVRRDGMELLKTLDKDGEMSEDEHHKNSAKVQELTDKLIKEIDQTLASKEAEIKQV